MFARRAALEIDMVEVVDSRRIELAQAAQAATRAHAGWRLEDRDPDSEIRELEGAEHAKIRGHRAVERGWSDVDSDDFGPDDEFAARIAVEIRSMPAHQLFRPGGARQSAHRVAEAAQRLIDGHIHPRQRDLRELHLNLRQYLGLRGRQPHEQRPAKKTPHRNPHGRNHSSRSYDHP
jgi:hypothetical protein